MAAPTTAKIIDIDVDQNEAQANLQFQDFSDTLQASSQARSGRPTSQAYTSFSDMNDDDEESDELLNRERREAGAPSFWKFSYYQSLFDVTTNDVLDRLLWSAVPRFSGPTYLERKIRPNPDLYGPIWVGLTLIVTTSVSSNVASYLQTAGQSKHIWHTDYTRVSFAATTIVLYISLVPLVLWAMLKYRKVESRYSLLETLCLYGYSLSIYVPISILWAVELWWLRWLLMTVGCVLSGLVLVATLWPSFRDDSRKVAFITSLVIFLLHDLLALGFVEYFFQHGTPTPGVAPTSSLPPLIASTASTHLSGNDTKSVLLPVSVKH